MAGVAVIAVPLTLEFTPTRLRTALAGFVTTAMVPIGILAAAVASATLADPLGWRPLFAIGVVPAALALFVRYYVPESPRWLLDQERAEEARRSVAYLLMRDEEFSLEGPLSASRSTASGPAALPHQRDRHDGRLVRRLGGGGRARALGADVPQGDPRDRQRRGCASVRVRHDRVVRQAVVLLVRSGAIRQTGVRRVDGVGAAPLLLLAGFSGETEVFGISLFLLALIAASFFVDGGFANLAPFTPEVFPTSRGRRGSGSLGVQRRRLRIVGPLAVGTIARTGDDPIEPRRRWTRWRRRSRSWPSRRCSPAWCSC